MPLLHVIGIGLDGATGLGPATQSLVDAATLLVGSSRHISYFPAHSAPKVELGSFGEAIAQIRHHLSETANPCVVVLTSGDPLFFGLGRLLLMEFPAEQLKFYPHLSSVQLAFSRAKIAWQDARVISVHGRALDELILALQQGASPLAVLTDGTNTPAAIARLLMDLDLPSHYQIWICENLGGPDEAVTLVTGTDTELVQLSQQSFAPLNVVVLQRKEVSASLNLTTSPILGLPDQAFLSFPDRPGLITKREIRTLVLAELALQSNLVIWDIGAGTGSVSIEIARLSPTSTIYAIEKTAIGLSLIQQNCQRFQVHTVHSVQGTAPDILRLLPAPDRVFIGGSGGNLTAILDHCAAQLRAGGRIILALTTLDHLSTTFNWLSTSDLRTRWHARSLQINLSRSVPVANLTRWSPLNPVTLVTLERN